MQPVVHWAKQHTDAVIYAFLQSEDMAAEKLRRDRRSNRDKEFGDTKMRIFVDLLSPFYKIKLEWVTSVPKGLLHDFLSTQMREASSGYKQGRGRWMMQSAENMDVGKLAFEELCPLKS